MEAAFILLAIGAMIGLMGAIPTLAAGIAAYLKAKAERENQVGTGGELEERVRRLEVALAETRDLAIQHSMSVEKNVDVLRGRIASMEKRTAEGETDSVQIWAE